MKRKKWIVPVGIFAALAALVLAVFIVRASADDLLHQSARLLYEASDGYAEFAFEVETPEKNASGAAKIWGRREAGPNGEPAFRIEILEASMDEAAGVTAVSDGTQVWLYKPSENTVYVGTFEEMKARMHEHEGDFTGHEEFDHPEFDPEDMPETPEEAVDKLLVYFTAERVMSADLSVNQLRLIPIPEEMPEELRANGGLLNIWLRASDNAPLGIEYTGGAVGYAKVSASTLELNQGVDEALFTFQIPEGAEVINLADIEPPPSLSADEADAAVDYDVLTPADLPGAARLEGINEMRGAIVQRYRLPEGKSFTVAQGSDNAASTAAGEDGEPVTVRGVEGTLYSDEGGGRTLLTWTEGEVTFWVGGDLTPESALSIANSLK